MTGSTYLAPDETTLYRQAALFLAETVSAAAQKEGRATAVFSGGSTPGKLYALLAGGYFRDRIPWRQLHVFWGDERCVPPDHADSNYKLANDLLLSRVPIPPANVHRVRGEMSSPAEAARAYQQELQVFFNLERSFPKFDFMLLGVGADGHTASLFPGADALNENEKWVTSHERRVTLTFPVINSAHRALFLVGGESKAGIVKEIFIDQESRRFPAQRVKPEHGELIWLLDPPAVSKLPPAVRHKMVHLEHAVGGGS